jgi:hypothetical protein
MASAPGAAGPGAPFPQWTVNTTGWVVAKVVNAQEKALAIASSFPNKLIFFTSQAAANAYVKSQHATPVSAPKAAQQALDTGSKAADPASWLSGLGGLLASGLESGFIAIIKDLWKLLLPALEILSGVILLIITLAFAFKDDLMKLAPLAAAAAV